MFNTYFVVRDPETGELYSVKVPDDMRHEIIRMERPSEKFLRVLRELKDNLKLNYKRLLAHGNDNKVATDILVKWVVRKQITSTEYNFLKETAIGNLKLLGIGSAELFVPGSSVTLPMILVAAGKNNINLFPNAWNKIKKERKKYFLDSKKDKDKILKLQGDIARYSGEVPLPKTKHQLKLEELIKKIDNAQ